MMKKDIFLHLIAFIHIIDGKDMVFFDKSHKTYPFLLIIIAYTEFLEILYYYIRVIATHDRVLYSIAI